eukprot:CAMPEP_0171011960 /NCGR_PEP_ID=MMETSP0736-20130129/23232_1 /TAXON_ID=186038 /ORGANISM="Fragilariopsis kerguelensis, Strain L26-C5" /LENGTH=411 /DNA_ID=CAMNT_0011444873 /DNA_START=80 /DNA_END=1314 /DNA_ORIENTATION=-
MITMMMLMIMVSTNAGVSAFYCSSIKSIVSPAPTSSLILSTHHHSSSSSSTMIRPRRSSSSSSNSRYSSRSSSNNYLERRRRSSGLVDKLIKEEKPKDQINEGNIGDYITELSSLSSTNDNERQLQALLPLFSSTTETDIDITAILQQRQRQRHYDVAHTLTSNPNENPVGGKWTRGSRFTKKLWTVKRTLQHILPPLPIIAESVGSPTVIVAQVINAIKLEILGGFISIWVLLRGDGVPLQLALSTEEEKDKQQQSSSTTITTNNSDDSNLESKKNKKANNQKTPKCSKAYFDRPRIGISVFRTRRKPNQYVFQKALSLGPTSAVVLDSPYVDNRVRLGMGGTSGTQFVFRRIQEKDKDVEGTDEWKWVLESNNTNKSVTTQKKKKRSVIFHGGILMYTIRTTKLQQASW